MPSPPSIAIFASSPWDKFESFITSSCIKMSWNIIKKINTCGMTVMKDSTDPRFLANKSLRNYLIPPIASKELRKIVVSFGAAIDQIPVTRAVVIKTTNTQPGTSPRLSFLINAATFDFKNRFNLIICSDGFI